MTDSRAASRPLRVAVDGAPLVESHTGITRYVRGLLDAADADMGVVFDVLLSPRRAGVEMQAATPAVAYRRLPKAADRAMSAALRFSLPVPGRVLHPRADAVLATRYWMPRWEGRPTITIVYDLVHAVAPATVNPAYLRTLTALAERAISRSTLLIAISSAVEAELHSSYPSTRGRTAVARPGRSELPRVDADSRKRELARLGLRPGYLLTVGTLEPRKNLVRLIEAVTSLPQRGSDAVLVLAGARGWSDDPIVAAVAASGGKVLHVGAVTELQLSALYGGAVALVAPSTYEGFGLPLLEAMASGVPCACSDIPVFREVAGEAAVFFDPLDVDSIGRVLQDLLVNPDLQRRLAAASHAQLAKFSWHESAAGAAEAIRNVVRDHQTRTGT